MILRLIKFLMKTIIFVAILCVGLYFLASYFLTDKIADYVMDELENSGQLEEARQYIDGKPEVKKVLESSANVDPSTLPFTTTGEAVETVVKKVGIKELQSMQKQYENGMTESEQLQLIQQLESQLSPSEAEAVKYVIYNELYK